MKKALLFSVSLIANLGFCQDIDQLTFGYLNNDTILDILVIESSDSVFVNKHAKVYAGDIHGKFSLFAESDKLFPGDRFTGRSDVYFDTLYIENSTVHWRSCVAPIYASSYSVIHFSFEFLPESKKFTLVGYEENYFHEPATEVPLEILLTREDLVGSSQTEFNMDDWLTSGHIFSADNVIVREETLEYWKTLANAFREMGEEDNANQVVKLIRHYYPD